MNGQVVFPQHTARDVLSFKFPERDLVTCGRRCGNRLLKLVHGRSWITSSRTVRFTDSSRCRNNIVARNRYSSSTGHLINAST